ncbi:MAG: hypothetical protein AABW59_04460 [archaeon]
MRRVDKTPLSKSAPIPGVRLSSEARQELWKFDSKKHATIAHDDILELSLAIRTKLKREGLTPELLPARFRVVGWN